VKSNREIYFYSILICIIIFSSIFAEEISGYPFFKIDFIGVTPPGADHILGTDFLGRDLLSRTLIGGRISILIGVFARSGSVLFGLIIGVIVGLSSRSLRHVLNGIIEIFLSIPSLLLAMGIAVVLGEGYRTIIMAIVIGTWAPVARFVSMKVIEIKNQDFILSAKGIGAGNFRVILFYILPALFPVLLPILSTGIATSIMMESTLSFLGLGGSSSIDSIPSWGLIIQEGTKFMFDAPWIILPPSIILTILILCFNQIGDKLKIR